MIHTDGIRRSLRLIPLFCTLVMQSCGVGTLPAHASNVVKPLI